MSVIMRCYEGYLSMGVILMTQSRETIHHTMGNTLSPAIGVDRSWDLLSAIGAYRGSHKIHLHRCERVV